MRASSTWIRGGPPLAARSDGALMAKVARAGPTIDDACSGMLLYAVGVDRLGHPAAWFRDEPAF